MGEDVALYGEHEALEAGSVPRIQEKYAINNPEKKKTNYYRHKKVFSVFYGESVSLA